MRYYRSGFSLVEIVVATFVLVLAVLPIYFALSGGAAQELDATKLSMARKILESFRSEVIVRSFSELKKLATAGTNFVVIDELFPNTESRVIAAQKQYKDFSFKGQIRVSELTTSVLEVNGTVHWTKSDGKAAKPEELRFVVVEP